MFIHNRFVLDLPEVDSTGVEKSTDHLFSPGQQYEPHTTQTV